MGTQSHSRFKLGILFNFAPSWMGGVMYIINIVKTLNFLDDEDKPELCVFYRADLERFLKEFDYPYINLVKWDFPSITKTTIKSRLSGKNLFISEILDQFPQDAVFPLQDYPVRTNTGTRLISWTPDFQHKYYPEFFSRKIRMGRHVRIKNTIRNTDDLILSSEDAKRDLQKFYKVRKGLKIHIYHFVSIMEDLKETDVDELKVRYNLPGRYFLVSNQFHKHKNHRILFLAQAKLKQMGIPIHLAITGKLPSASDSPYMAELHSIINNNQLRDQISILGMIPRAEQLTLMKHAQAVLQPSLFEGWSTVIEDARSLQVPVVASNLKVNMEQLGEDGVYFDPHNADKLVHILKRYPERNLADSFYDDYAVRVRQAASTLMKIFNSDA